MITQKQKLWGILALLVSFFAHDAKAEEIDLSGYMSIDTRYFTQEPRYSDQKNGSEASLVLNPMLDYERLQNRLGLSLFYRKDSRDDQRTHFDIRKAYWKYENNDWQYTAGIDEVFWGVATSHHLVNIINQTDIVEDIVTEDYRLGQPVLSVSKDNEWGEVSFYLLPYFRERTFAGRNGRIRSPLPVDTDNPIYESSEKEKHIDFSTRYFLSNDNLNWGIDYFYGTTRDPGLRVNNAGTHLLPVYNIINQLGTDARYTHGNWTWKLEGLIREGQGDTFQAFVAGFDYIFPKFLGSKADLGLVNEYAYDNRDSEAGFTGFDDDAFTGFWIVFNDKRQTCISATMAIDTDSSETFYNLKAKQTLINNYDVEFLARFFSDAKPGDEIYPAEQDDYIQLRLIRNF